MKQATGFSRKVLDRAFALEFSEVDLEVVPQVSPVAADPWSVDDWRQPILSLADADRDDDAIQEAVAALSAINEALSPIQLQVGYRVRDEAAIFCMNAREVLEHFKRSDGSAVAPLDLAVAMKVLPRIQGGSAGVRTALERLAQWATGDGTQPSFPYSLERIELMLARLDDEGFTSYWL